MGPGEMFGYTIKVFENRGHTIYVLYKRHSKEVQNK